MPVAGLGAPAPLAASFPYVPLAAPRKAGVRQGAAAVDSGASEEAFLAAVRGILRHEGHVTPVTAAPEVQAGPKLGAEEALMVPRDVIKAPVTEERIPGRRLEEGLAAERPRRAHRRNAGSPLGAEVTGVRETPSEGADAGRVALGAPPGPVERLTVRAPRKPVAPAERRRPRRPTIAAAASTAPDSKR